MAAAMVIRGSKLVYYRGFSSLRGPVLSGLRRREPRVFCNQTILRYVNRSAITRAKSDEGMGKSFVGEDGWHLVYEGRISADLAKYKNWMFYPIIAAELTPLIFLYTEDMPLGAKGVLGATCVVALSCSSLMYYWIANVYVFKVFFKPDEMRFAFMSPSYGTKPARKEFHISDLTLIDGRLSNIRTKDGNFVIDPKVKEARQILKFIREWKENN